MLVAAAHFIAQILGSPSSLWAIILLTINGNIMFGSESQLASVSKDTFNLDSPSTVGVCYPVPAAERSVCVVTFYNFFLSPQDDGSLFIGGFFADKIFIFLERSQFLERRGYVLIAVMKWREKLFFFYCVSRISQSR